MNIRTAITKGMMGSAKGPTGVVTGVNVALTAPAQAMLEDLEARLGVPKKIFYEDQFCGDKWIQHGRADHDYVVYAQFVDEWPDKILAIWGESKEQNEALLLRLLRRLGLEVIPFKDQVRFVLALRGLVEVDLAQ